MDEKYLDDLLGQVSQEGGQSNTDINLSMYEDADVKVDMSDLGDISLDELDDLDSVDLSDLDFDDIDFDDIDVTSLHTNNAKQSEESQAEADFNLDALIQESDNLDMTFDEELQMTTDVGGDSIPKQETEPVLEPVVPQKPVQEEVFQAAEAQMEADTSIPVAEDVDSMDLDALFSALGIEDEESSEGGASAYTAGQSELDALFESSAQLSMEMGELDEIQDIDDIKSGKSKNKKKKKDGKKKSFSEILFGEMDEEDEEEERLLAENKEKKRIRKEQKKQVKDEKKAEKRETLEIKKKSDEANKQKVKAEKAKRKDAELQAELEEAKNEKHVSNLTVIIVFGFFIGLAVLVIFGTKIFSYNQVIKRAEDYFDRQRYRLAYDEVSGVEVKPKDEDLRDRIYTVMYVERLYESYENNIQLGRPDVALDALIRGIQKYDEHYEEAVELNIVDDINVCRAKIVAALEDTYHMTEEQAYALSVLEGKQYSTLLLEYSSVVLVDNDKVQGE